jgi:hypothetical protein
MRSYPIPGVIYVFDLHVSDSAPTHYDDSGALDHHQVKAISARLSVRTMSNPLLPAGHPASTHTRASSRFRIVRRGGYQRKVVVEADTSVGLRSH